ncbi:GFA family protein [Pseudoalteromonas fenneropenaei]|uniref:GFA family protein n=1 Tax=Pseudoalteromonas fenneropenaei TaxID=1737459 RepID=A0ABV7CMT4_9GAMM
MEFPIHAACQCGQVTYKLFAAPKMVLACHCKECQTLATAPFSVTALVSADDIEISGEMQEWERMAESGNRNRAKFCTGCGNRVLHFNPDDAHLLKLKLKPTDRKYDALFTPTAHVWTSEKVSWFELPEGVKSFPKQP